MKRKILISVVIAVFIILISICIRLYYDKQYMQDAINAKFEYHYNVLIFNLHSYDESDNKDTENTKHGALLDELRPYTSYCRNYYLDNVVGLLEQSSGHDAFMKINMDDELYHKLMELNGSFNSVELAEEAVNMLNKAVVE